MHNRRTHVRKLKFEILIVLISSFLLFLNTAPALAHPADITVTDFFVDLDWDNNEIERDRLRAVHSLNWFEAMDVLDPEATAADMLSDLQRYEPVVQSYLNDNLTVSTASTSCAFENIYIPEQSAGEVTAVGFFFDFEVVCPTPISDVVVSANFLLEKYPEQSNFLTFYRTPGDLIVTDSLNPENPTASHLISDPEVQQTPLELFVEFLYQGIRHIVPLGLDHILFIATVFLVAGALRRVVLYSLLFTAAHSVTLALTVLGVIVPSSSLIEAIIALSIIVLAIDAIRPFIPKLWQGAVIFGFGLFHGMGFASVLTELGLPAEAELLALLSFNLGVEIGQLGVIFLLFVATWWFFKDNVKKRFITIALATAIAVIATYWLIERTLL